MCGIVGFIGTPKHRNVCYALTTALLRETEERGTDATGFWASETGKGSLIFDKLPKKSSEYVKEDFWKDMKNHHANILIGHCRKKSMESNASEKVNKNNHPFLSEDKRLALVHNGNVPDFRRLKKDNDLETVSECDSEVLLRIIESGQYYDPDYIRSEIGDMRNEKGHLKDVPKEAKIPSWAKRMMGLRDIFAQIKIVITKLLQRII